MYQSKYGEKSTTLLKESQPKPFLGSASAFPCKMKQLSLLNCQSIFVVFPKKRTEDKLFFLNISINCSVSDIEL